MRPISCVVAGNGGPRVLEVLVASLRGFRIASLVSIAPVAGFLALHACSESPPLVMGNGVDTRDATATTDGAVSCATPNDDCPCASPGESVECGKVFRQSSDYISCSMGKRTCGADGKWGTCIGDTIATRNVPGDVLGAKSNNGVIETKGLGTSQSCAAANPCDPACSNFVDTPTGLDGGAEAGFQVVDGAIVPNSTTTTCPAGTLFCFLPLCAGGTTTSLKGVVYDPAGRNPLSNVTVFVPTTTAPLPAIPVGPAADACGGVPTVTAMSSTVTDVNGNFELKNLPVGVNVPLVIQIGKWRRQFTIAPLVQCVANDLTAATEVVNSTIAGVTRSLTLPRFRLPSTQGADSNIPQMGISLGGSDPFACLFTKIGLDTSEFTDNTKSGRMHVFSGLDTNGAVYGGLNGVTPPAADKALWNSLTNLKKYDIVLTSCEGAENNTTKPATAKTAVRDYLNSGGRFFGTHFHYTWFKNSPSADFQGIANWTGKDRTSNTTGQFSLVTTFARGKAFRDWLAARNALDAPASANKITLGEWREDMYEPLGNSLSFIESPVGTTNWIGNTRQSTKFMTFNAPIGNPAATQFGRAVMSDIHVSPGDSTDDMPNSCVQSTTIPCLTNAECLLVGGKTCNTTNKTCYNSSGKQMKAAAALPCATDLQCGGTLQCIRGRCLNAMTAQEKALEYLFFDLASCVTDATAPPPSTTYSDAVFVRDYVATCPAQKQPRWTYFDYQGDFPGAIPNDPTGTSMELRFVTATDQAALNAAAKPGTAMWTVKGKQTISTWTGVDVAPLLPGGASQSYLRVFIDLKASTDRQSAPSLTAWRQNYTCVDAE